MNCDLPILTDSGGFQVMSLSKLNKIDREKVQYLFSCRWQKIHFESREKYKNSISTKLRYFDDHG